MKCHGVTPGTYHWWIVLHTTCTDRTGLRRQVPLVYIDLFPGASLGVGFVWRWQTDTSLVYCCALQPTAASALSCSADNAQDVSRHHRDITVSLWYQNILTLHISIAAKIIVQPAQWTNIQWRWDIENVCTTHAVAIWEFSKHNQVSSGTGFHWMSWHKSAHSFSLKNHCGKLCDRSRPVTKIQSCSPTVEQALTQHTMNHPTQIHLVFMNHGRKIVDNCGSKYFQALKRIKG